MRKKFTQSVVSIERNSSRYEGAVFEKNQIVLKKKRYKNQVLTFSSAITLCFKKFGIADCSGKLSITLLIPLHQKFQPCDGSFRGKTKIQTGQKSKNLTFPRAITCRFKELNVTAYANRLIP